MPRDGSGVYSAPAGTSVTSGTTIESAPYNAFVADLVSDANTVRPVVAGGTGASTVGAAQTAFKIPPFDGTPTITGAWIFNAANGITAQSLLSNTLLMGTSVAADTPSKITMRKARGGGTAAQITAGDDLGILKFQGYDGSAYQDACRIVGTSTTNTGNMGGVLEFYTAGTTLALTLDQNQDATFVGDIGAVNIVASGDVSAAAFSGAGVSSDISADTGSTTKVPHVAAVEAAIAAAKGSDGPDATTSGTAHDFTGVPATANKIEIILNAVSLSGTDNLLIQALVGGTPVTSGYASSGSVTGGSAVSSTGSTSGMIVSTGGASFASSGRMTFVKVPGTTTWVADHTMRRDGTSVSYGGGVVDAGGTVNGLRLTRTGSNTFDAGQAFIRWEA